MIIQRIMPRRVDTRIFALVLVVVLWTSLANGQQPEEQRPRIETLQPGKGPVYIQANEVTYNFRTQVVTLEGNVVIVQEDARIEADQVTFDTRDNSGEARGNARFFHGSDRLTGDVIRFHMETRKGMVINGQIFLEDRHFYITGNRIEKTGESTYLIDNGSFTSCDENPADWSFRGRKIDLNMGGYATAESVTFRVREFPIFYLPYAIYPIKTERKTGFLIPRPGHSTRDGFMLDVPFFWAISRSSDATITPRFFSRRGVGVETEFRAVPSARSRGEITLGYLNDQLEEDEEDFGLFRRTRQHRWRIQGWSELEKGEPLSAFMCVNLVGDRDFLQEFGKGNERSLPYLESRGEVAWKTDHALISPRIRYFQDMATSDDKATFQALPEVEAQTFTQPLYGGWLGSVRAAFRNAWREEGYQGLSAEVEPTFFLPIKWDNYLIVVPELAFREVAEYVEDDPVEQDTTDHQGISKVALTAFTRLERIFSTGWGGLDKLRHTVEPSVTYLWTNRLYGEDQRRLPVYSPPLTFAGEAPDLFLDMPEEQHALWFGFSTFLDGKAKAASARLAEVRILQGYGVDKFEEPGEDGQWWSDLYVELFLHPVPFVDLGWDFRYDHQNDELVSSNVRFGLMDHRNDMLHLEWRYRNAMGEEAEINTINADMRVSITKEFSLFMESIYDRVERLVVKNALSFEYQPQCWHARLTLSDEAGQSGQKRDQRVMFFLTLYGLGPLVQW